MKPTASFQNSEQIEVTHPYERGQYSSWTPDGKYFVCISHDSIELYNTNNELEKHSPFSPPKEMFLDSNYGHFYYVLFSNSGFYLVKNQDYPDENHYLLWKSGDEYIISDFYYIDWEGNIIIHYPKSEVQSGEAGNQEYYIESRKAEPILADTQCKLIDDDLLMFCFSPMFDPQRMMPYGIDNTYCAFYIPSQNKFIGLGRQENCNHFPVASPKGVLWGSWNSGQLVPQVTSADSTIPLFGDRAVNYFYSDDDIAVLILTEEYWGVEHGYVTPILYASWETLELKRIGERYGYFSSFDINTVQLAGPYIVYEDYEKGLIAYDTRTGEYWGISEDPINLNKERLEGARLKNGELEVLFEGAVATKDKITYYPNEEYRIHRDSINPPKTHYVCFSDDHSAFAIKPYLGWED